MSQKKALNDGMEKAAELPGEFAGFVKEIGLRAFNALAQSLAPLKIDDDTPRLHRLAATWNSMDAEEKAEFFSQIIAAGALLSAAAPAIKKIASSRLTRSKTRKSTSKAKSLLAKSGIDKKTAVAAATGLIKLTKDMKEKSEKQLKKAKKDLKKKKKKAKKK